MLKGTEHLPLEVLAGQLQSYQFLSETLWQLDARRSMIGLRSVIPDASTIDDITGNCDDFRRLGPLTEHGPHPYITYCTWVAGVTSLLANLNPPRQRLRTGCSNRLVLHW